MKEPSRRVSLWHKLRNPHDYPETFSTALVTFQMVLWVAAFYFNYRIDHDVIHALIASSGILLGILLSMWFYDRDPRKWWGQFHGTNVRVNRSSLIAREQAGESSDAIRQEIHQWIESSCKYPWIKVNSECYRFFRRRDAVMFKLAWG
jgi:hypothetical protein